MVDAGIIVSVKTEKIINELENLIHDFDYEIHQKADELTERVRNLIQENLETFLEKLEYKNEL